MISRRTSKQQPDAPASETPTCLSTDTKLILRPDEVTLTSDLQRCKGGEQEERTASRWTRRVVHSTTDIHVDNTLVGLGIEGDCVSALLLQGAQVKQVTCEGGTQTNVQDV